MPSSSNPSKEKPEKPSEKTLEPASGPLVLVVDDERPIRRFLRAALSTEGYRVQEAGGVADAMAKVAGQRPDAVILDLGLPDGDGRDVILKMREWTNTPVIVLSVRGQEADKVSALDAGADDYLTKPFGTGELLARLRAALRRAAQDVQEPVVTTGKLTIDLARRRVTVAGKDANLTATEYALLRALAINPGKVLTHNHLLRTVWGTGYETESHLLRVNISNLRRKIEPDPVQPTYVLTEPGVGYRLRDPDPD